MRLAVAGAGGNACAGGTACVGAGAMRICAGAAGAAGEGACEAAYYVLQYAGRAEEGAIDATKDKGEQQQYY